MISEEKREKWAEDLFEDIIAKNFPTLGKETEIQIQEAKRSPPKSTLKHIIIKMEKVVIKREF